VVGAKAAELDTDIFDAATAWKAIVLIDEVGISSNDRVELLTVTHPQADVFLEQRSLYNLERNAMVAVL
jgi:hypothetical protein